MTTVFILIDSNSWRLVNKKEEISMTVKKKPRNTGQLNSFFLLGMVLNITIVLVISSIIIDIFPNENRGIFVQASQESREIGSAAGLHVTDASSALTHANDQLVDMNVGSIHTLDENDPNYMVTCFRDYEIGDEVYWELEDSNTTVYVWADNGEIIFYEHTGWVTGSMTKNQILSQAATIANQFEDLPSDRTNPEANFYSDKIEIGLCNQVTQDEIVSYKSCWEIIYNRSKNNIITEDHIQLLLLPNGYLSQYSKVWFMQLDSFSTSYTVSQATAETTAEALFGGNSHAETSYKRIVRPNNIWFGTFNYGSSPGCVWEVWIHDDDDNLCLVQVDGTLNTIVGGDIIENYYE